MARVKIDSGWTRSVCAFIQGKKCVWDVGGLRRFKEAFPFAWEWEFENTVVRLFRSDVLGCKKTLQFPDKRVHHAYDFFTPFSDGDAKRTEDLYTKIGVRDDQSLAVIYSAHRPDPDKGLYLSCDDNCPYLKNK